jgi:Protein of unknown function (DUF1203)
MGYRISGISSTPFEHLYGMEDEALAEHGARRYVVDEKPGFPDRVCLRDAEIGEAVLLVNYTHQPTQTPYRSNHAIFVLEGAKETASVVDAVPEVLQCRTLSLRAFDEEGWMLDADIVEGREAEGLIRKFFSNPQVAYIHAHNARRGCFAARIDRN